jgi:hypothetical protein
MVTLIALPSNYLVKLLNNSQIFNNVGVFACDKYQIELLDGEIYIADAFRLYMSTLLSYK